ncbi:MAG: ATP-binding cassette domain-containing protein [Acidimicrobiales bacterium]|nr:ATP-binding cassette domain-containing protein [Acidimicrobiales bacterium]
MSLRIDGTLQRGDLTLELDFDLPFGITAITGPNGAGKSSILRLVAGLEALDAGRLTLDGVVLDDRAAEVFIPAEERNVSIAFQQPRLFPHLTVLQNIAYPLRRQGHAPAEATELARPFAERVRATSLLDLRPRRLSGGQAQRTAIAVAMAVGASTILLDEPLTSIDEAGTADIRRLLHQLDTPRVVWVTHDPADAHDADHQIILGSR